MAPKRVIKNNVTKCFLGNRTKTEWFKEEKVKSNKITYQELVEEVESDKMSYNDILVGIHVIMKSEYKLYELSSNDTDFIEFMFLLVSKYNEPNKILPILKRFVHLYEYHTITKRSIELYRIYFNMAPVGSVALPAQHFINIYQDFLKFEQTDIILGNLNKFKVTEQFVEVITGPIYTMDKTLLNLFIDMFPEKLEFVFDVIAKERNSRVFEYLSGHLKFLPPVKMYEYMSQIYNIPPVLLNTVSNLISNNTNN